MENLVIYGAGERGRNLISLMDSCGWEIGAVVDSSQALWGTYIGSHRIKSPEVLRNMEGITVCITSVFYADSIRNTMRDILKEEVREISYTGLIRQIYAVADFSDLLGNEPVYKKHSSVIFSCLDGMVLGGVQEWAKDICMKFLQEGNEYTYILSSGCRNSTVTALKEHILYADIETQNINSINNIRKLIVCLKKCLPCVLVTSYPYEVYAGEIVKAAYPDKIRIISGIRNAAENTYQEYIDFRECVDTYVCVSSDIAREMIKRGIEKERVHTMICPVSCPAELTRLYTTERTKPIRLGYAGRIVISQKRMDLMEKLIADLEKRKVNYYFELAGEGDYQDKIQEFIVRGNLQERVRLAGVLDKHGIGIFWRDKDICINIADFEGRSRSIAEAMANGAVPVVTNTSGVNDDIRDGENGYIVSTGDYGAMADRIEEIERNRNLLPDKGMKAHMELKEKCSMDRHYQFWRELIRCEMGE